MHNKVYEDIISKVAKRTGLPEKLVDRTYRAYWKVIRQHITSLPLKEDLSDEEFLKLRPNVNIPSIGKLYVTLDIYRGIKESYALNTKNKEDKYKKQDNNVKNKRD